MYSWLARNTMAPVMDFLRGTRTMKCLKKLEQSQWWPRDKILELQNQRLRELAKHAYDNVPYYRRIFEERGLKPSDITSSQALVKLPILNKQLVRKKFDHLRAPGFPAKDIVSASTGGSTGELLNFYTTKNESRNWGFAAAQRAYGWGGYKVGEKCLLLGLIPKKGSMVERHRRKLAINFERILLFSPAAMSAENLALLTKKLAQFQPSFIRGYPSAIYLLALFIEREGKPKLRPKAVITTAEAVYDYQRDLFGKVFGCETYSHYGAAEQHTIAGECPEHHGYHIAAENVIVEIVDDAGEPVPAGKEGRILITNLHSYVMPFIRYDIGDLGVISDKACPCGRGLPLLGRVSGRVSDVILTRSGERLPGIVLPWSFLASLGVDQFQIVQESYEKVVVKLVVGREYPQERTDELTRAIISQYRDILGEDMDIVVEFVDHIPITARGKRRVVISKLLEK